MMSVSYTHLDVYKRQVLYTDGTLIAVLTSPIKLFQDATAKTLGKTLKVQIGRPSTRGATIDTLIQLGYLEIKKEMCIRDSLYGDKVYVYKMADNGIVLITVMQIPRLYIKCIKEECLI